MCKLRAFHAKMRSRLGSSGGETLVETLVAILVSSLAMLMLANAISSATGIVGMSRRAASRESDAMAELEPAGTQKKTLSVELVEVAGSETTATPRSMQVLTKDPVAVAGGYQALSYTYEGDES